MTLTYTHLTVADQRAMLAQRLTGWEAEHYIHAINAAVAQANTLLDPDTQAEQITAATDAMTVLEQIILATREQLAALPAPTDPA